MEKAERVLGKVETALRPTEDSRPPETITDEERFMFRKLGLRMKAFLLLGNSFVFFFVLDFCTVTGKVTRGHICPIILSVATSDYLSLQPVIFLFLVADERRIGLVQWCELSH